jgi:hypothetical protein
MFHHHCVLLLGFFELLGLYYDFLQDQGLYFSIIDVDIGVRDCCSQRCHAWYDDDEDPTVTEVRCDLLDLDLLETAYSLM